MTVRRLKNRRFDSRALTAVVVSLVMLAPPQAAPYTRTAKAQSNAATITLSPCRRRLPAVAPSPYPS
jgi:hypothetical protein